MYLGGCLGAQIFLCIAICWVIAICVVFTYHAPLCAVPSPVFQSFSTILNAFFKVVFFSILQKALYMM